MILCRRRCHAKRSDFFDKRYYYFFLSNCYYCQLLNLQIMYLKTPY